MGKIGIPELTESASDQGMSALWSPNRPGQQHRSRIVGHVFPWVEKRCVLLGDGEWADRRRHRGKLNHTDPMESRRLIRATHSKGLAVL